MEDHIKIRQEYVRLVRAGKHDEARKLLEIIWGRNVDKVEEVKEETPSKKEHKKVKKSKEVRFSEIKDLSKIKGIGIKTVKDIEIMFDSIDKLKVALDKDKVALRDDIVEKLKEVLI